MVFVDMGVVLVAEVIFAFVAWSSYRAKQSRLEHARQAISELAVRACPGEVSVSVQGVVTSSNGWLDELAGMDVTGWPLAKVLQLDSMAMSELLATCKGWSSQHLVTFVPASLKSTGMQLELIMLQEWTMHNGLQIGLRFSGSERRTGERSCITSNTETVPDACPGDCISADCSVATEGQGSVRIGNLAAGDRILAVDPSTRALTWDTVQSIKFTQAETPRYEIESSSGAKSVTTANHPVVAMSASEGRPCCTATARLNKTQNVMVFSIREESIKSVRELSKSSSEVVSLELKRPGLAILVGDHSGLIAMLPSAADELGPEHNTPGNPHAAGQAAAQAVSEESGSSFQAQQAHVAVRRGEPVKVMLGPPDLAEELSLATLQAVPRDGSGTRLSIGSALHASGECTPCTFFGTSRPCRDGALCRWCHAGHEDLSRSARRQIVKKQLRKKREEEGAQSAESSTSHPRATLAWPASTAGTPQEWRGDRPLARGDKLGRHFNA